MLLIIPTIPIVHGLCAQQIAGYAHEIHQADREIYTQNPIDRARLLRKENAKAIHLEFWDSDPWSVESLMMITHVKTVVDIPVGVGLHDLPQHPDQVQSIFDAGVHRILLPSGCRDEEIAHFIGKYSCRKIIPTLELNADTERWLREWKDCNLDRVALDISPRDTLETSNISWSILSKVAELAFSLKIRLTLLHGIRGYPELLRLQEIGGSLDSLVLSRALNENRFPCQLIWREMEAEYALESTPESNHWSNPLGPGMHV